MTRVDEACPLVQKDLRKIYTSKRIKEKVITGPLCSQIQNVVSVLWLLFAILFNILGLYNIITIIIKNIYILFAANH